MFLLFCPLHFLIPWGIGVMHKQSFEKKIHWEGFTFNSSKKNRRGFWRKYQMIYTILKTYLNLTLEENFKMNGRNSGRLRKRGNILGVNYLFYLCAWIYYTLF